MQDMSEQRVAERCVDDELDENLAFRWIFGHQTRPSLQSDLFGPRRAEHSAEPLISKGPIPPSPTPLGQKRHLLRNRRPSATDPNSPLQSAAAQMRMSIVHFRHRFFVRQYVYPLLCLLLLIVLIRWTTDRNVNEKMEYGRLWHDEGKTDQIQKVNIETVATPLQPLIEEKKVVDSDAVRPAPIAKKPTGNIVSLEVYMEAQCPDTSAFIHRQLVPAWNKLGHLQRINVTIVPFGKALCKPHNEDYICDCQHGPSECDLNGLMNCAMERLVQPREYVPLIGCIQGSDDLDSAIAKCFSPGADKDWISQCSKSKRARYLLAMAGQRTNALGSQFNFVPWVVIDGVRNIDSFYALEENICKLFTTPVPAECLPGSSVQQVQAIEQPFRL